MTFCLLVLTTTRDLEVLALFSLNSEMNVVFTFQEKKNVSLSDRILIFFLVSFFHVAKQSSFTPKDYVTEFFSRGKKK